MGFRKLNHPSQDVSVARGDGILGFLKISASFSSPVLNADVIDGLFL